MTSKSLVRITDATLILTVLAGCQTEASRTEAGRLAQSGEVWMMEAEPSVVIGTKDELPGHALQRVAGAIRTSDGRLMVGDGAAATVFVYDSLGNMQTAVGGPGEGPTEFGPFDLFARGVADTTYVLTSGGELVTIAPDGTVEGKTRYPGWPAAETCRVADHYRYGMDVPSVVLVRSDVVLVRAHDFVRYDHCPNIIGRESYRGTTLLALFDWRRSVIDTLGIFPGPEYTGLSERMYGRGFRAAVSPEAIFAGDTGSDSISVFTVEGALRGTIRLPMKEVPISPDARPSRSERFPMPDGGYYEAYDYPTTYPVYARLKTDSSGRLWVMKYPALTEPRESRALAGFLTRTPLSIPTEWTVMTSEGEVVARVPAPPDLYVLDVGTDYVLGLSRDSFGVEVVKLFRLNRAGS